MAPSVPFSAIKEIAMPLFPSATLAQSGNTFSLKLNNQATISYPCALDAIVASQPINNALSKRIRIIFQRFNLKMFDTSFLEHKIAKTIEKFINPPPPRQPGQKLDIMQNAKKLFEKGVLADYGAKNQNVVLFIGETGSAKSTTMNYLLNLTLKSVKGNEIGNASNRPVIIAEYSPSLPMAKIGYRAISKTLEPQVVLDILRKLAYVDCQGWKDTRGPPFEIYAALSLIQVIENAQRVQGCLVFFDIASVQGPKAVSIEDTLKSLQLLLKDFKIHQRAVAFIVTKSPKGTDVNDLKILLEEKIEVLSQSQDPDLGKFCQAILDSGIFKNVFGERVFIYDPILSPTHPLGHKERNDIFNAITSFSYPANAQLEFGFPVSDKTLNILKQTRDSFVFHAIETLEKLERSMESLWNNQVPTGSIATTEQFLTNLEQWLSHLTTPKLTLFAQAKSYFAVPQSIVDELNLCLQYWEKMERLDSQKYSIDDHLMVSFNQAKKTLNSIRVKTRAALYAKIKTAFEEALQTNPARLSIAALHQTSSKIPHSPATLPISLAALQATINHVSMANTPNDLCIGLQQLNLVQFSNAHLVEILTNDQPKIDALKLMIHNLIDKPVKIPTLTQKLAIIDVHSSILFSELQEALLQISSWDVQQISINASDKVIYLDTDLPFAGKIVSILAQRFEVAADCSLKLKAINIRAECAGNFDFENNRFTPGPLQAKKVLGWRWL